ncbi:MAG: hypothetical protein ACKOE6_04770, partial [Flammeovirgaceae bacterium]
AYRKFSQTAGNWSSEDHFNFAEVLLTLKDYAGAIREYQKMRAQPSTAEWVQEKIWRISNLAYLYEDSIHLAVRGLAINSPFAEWCGRTQENGIMFLSNASKGEVIQKVDAATNQNFFSFFHSKQVTDTLLDGWGRMFNRPERLPEMLNAKGNLGGFCFYKNNTQLVFTSSTGRTNRSGIIPLGLFFASKVSGKWVITNEYEYNSTIWSVTNPWIDPTGEILYFASNRNDGFGGYDLYVSHFNKTWSEPKNLGANINSPWDEQHPWWNSGSLFFASNGHAGLGGFDLYQTQLGQDQQPVNMGYPINSEFDDFAISFTDSLSTHGFLSSNRKRGGLDDDLYE